MKEFQWLEAMKVWPDWAILEFILLQKLLKCVVIVWAVVKNIAF